MQLVLSAPRVFSRRLMVRSSVLLGLLFTLLLASLAVPASASPWMTGYFDANNSILTPQNVPWAKYTHVIHFAASTDGNGNVIPFYVKSATEVQQLISGGHSAGVKVVICIKDNDNNTNNFGQSTTSGLVNQFVSSIASFVQNPYVIDASGKKVYATGVSYDGVDIDWEKNVNITQFNTFLQLLHTSLAALPGAVITMSGNYNNAKSAVYGTSNGFVDQANIMCYDLDWGDDFAWYVSPILQSGNSGAVTCAEDLASFSGAPPSRIGIGIPFYGRRRPGATQAFQSSNWAKATEVFYRDLVVDPTRYTPANRFYDNTYKANYLSIPSLNEFDSYTDTQAIDDTVQWARSKGLGGYMTFALECEYMGGTANPWPLSTELYNAAVLGNVVVNPSQLLSLVISAVATSVSPTSATITWNTNEPAGGKVQYGTSSSYGISAAATTNGQSFAVTLTRLSPRTTYHYQIQSTDVLGNTTLSADLMFTTK